MRQPAFVWLLGLLACLSVPAQPTESDKPLDAPREGRFVYLRSEARITLQASRLYSAALVTKNLGHRGPLTPPDGLELDPRGDRTDLIERGLTLFRVPNTVAPRGLDVPPPPDAWQAALDSGLPAQPVFEHGAALRIPTDEVIVAFDPATTLEDAKRLVSESEEELDPRRLREFRPGGFVYALRELSAGAAFEISRVLTRVGGVLWAEPSFINIHLETPGPPPDGRVRLDLPSSLTHEQVLQSAFVTIKLSTTDREFESGGWRVTIDGHFEDDIDKWIVARDEGSNRVLPVVVRTRAHDGKHSVYMSGKGLDANTPPDPYVERASSYLISPIFNLSEYDDVFVEMWFWARFEDPVGEPRQVYDFGRVALYDVAAEEYVYEHPITPVGPTGDLTRAPGTDRGWRKLLFRVPLELRASPLQVRVQFKSDEINGAEGLYVDDLRVIYGSGDGGDPFCRDPAAQQQYAIAPRGQIAGWPASDDPRTDASAAWSLGIREKQVIVALLDDGVERGHPDLAFWEPAREGDPPEDEEPLFPGEPLAPEDRHGTACAGLLGAIANNGIGIAGVAPGAQLLPLHRGVDDVSIVQAIDAAVENGAHVLVIPWGFSGVAPRAITLAIVDAIEAGTTVVAAAGDGVHRPYGDDVDFPCSLSAATPLICVGASSIAGEPKGPASADGLYWWTSAEGLAGPDLLAPGTWLHATDRRGPLGYNDGSQSLPSDWTDEFAGTGASACYVGGVAALMASYDPLLTPAELKRLIVASATRLPVSTGRTSDLRLVEPAAAGRAAVESAAARSGARLTH